MRYCLLISCWLLVADCSREAWHAPMVVPTDSTALLLPGLPAGKYKFNGPVNITIQKGNNNTAAPSAIGKIKADAAATGPGSTATSQQAGTPWWVFGLCILGGAVGGMWLRGRLPFLSFR